MPGSLGSGSGSSGTTNCFSLAEAATDLGNLAQRVERLELILSQLLGTNISAIQLSDISSDGGLLTNLSLSSGASGVFLSNLGRINTYMLSGLDEPFQGSGEYNEDVIMGVMRKYDTGTTLNSFQGSLSAAMYRAEGGIFDGGFYYECRAAFVPPLLAPNVYDPTLEKCRFYAGLSNGINGAVFSNDSSMNVANPPAVYMVFSYSDPRGDTTWKFMKNNAPTEFTYDDAIVIDTGIPVINYHWYDMVIKCLPSSQTLQWAIKDLNTGVSASGVTSSPQVYMGVSGIYDGHDDPIDGTWSAGVGAFVSTATHSTHFAIHHLFAQSLSTDSP